MSKPSVNQIMAIENNLEAKQLDKGAPVFLSFKDLNYGVDMKNSHKEILKDICGSFKSGTVTAILGASGGGKTSLLNVLSGKIKKGGNVKLSGEIKANGQTFSNDQFNRFSAYVMQNDILLETLTAKECIQFAADFKLSGSDEFKKGKVEEMISSLKLNKCQNTLIGGQFLKGVSGGERKRVNIGCELITDPSVIFLDEPTSGLDSFTAYIVISTLKEFAKRHNKTVIMSIHSPNTDIWNLFDNIILLVLGRMIFQGHRDEAIGYFKNIGFECPKHMCPADFLMEYMTWNEENEKIFPLFYENYDKTIKDKIVREIDSYEPCDIPQKQIHTSFWFQTKLIAKRTFLSMERNPILLKSRIYQTIVMSLFIGLVYLNQDKINRDSTSIEIQNKVGVLLVSGMGMFMKSLNGVLLSFPAEREVFLKEENSKYYTTIAYLSGRLSLEYLQISLYPFINAVFIYFMVDLNQDKAEYFFYYLLIQIILSWIGNSLGLICGTVFTNPRTSTALQPIFKLPFILFSGYIKNRNDYASWIGWIQYLSPFTYALEGLVTNEFEGVDAPYDIKKAYDFNIGKWNCFFCLIGLFVFYQGLAVFALYKKRGSLQ